LQQIETLEMRKQFGLKNTKRLLIPEALSEFCCSSLEARMMVAADVVVVVVVAAAAAAAAVVIVVDAVAVAE
jgi:hypothetical protein